MQGLRTSRGPASSLAAVCSRCLFLGSMLGGGLGLFGGMTGAAAAGGGQVGFGGGDFGGGGDS